MSCILIAHSKMYPEYEICKMLMLIYVTRLRRRANAGRRNCEVTVYYRRLFLMFHSCNFRCCHSRITAYLSHQNCEIINGLSSSEILIHGFFLMSTFHQGNDITVIYIFESLAFHQNQLLVPRCLLLGHTNKIHQT